MEKATKMQQAGEKVIHLEIGRPDFDTPKKIKDAAYESLNAGHVFYTSNYGTPALRKEIAKWENEHHNVNYETSEVLVTVGLRLFLGSGTLLRQPVSDLFVQLGHQLWGGFEQLLDLVTALSQPLLVVAKPGAVFFSVW